MWYALHSLCFFSKISSATNASVAVVHAYHNYKSFPLKRAQPLNRNASCNGPGERDGWGFLVIPCAYPNPHRCYSPAAETAVPAQLALQQGEGLARDGRMISLWADMAMGRSGS